MSYCLSEERITYIRSITYNTTSPLMLDYSVPVNSFSSTVVQGLNRRFFSCSSAATLRNSLALNQSGCCVLIKRCSKLQMHNERDSGVDASLSSTRCAKLLRNSLRSMKAKPGVPILEVKQSNADSFHINCELLVLKRKQQLIV